MYGDLRAWLRDHPFADNTGLADQLADEDVFTEEDEEPIPYMLTSKGIIVAQDRIHAELASVKA